MGKILNKEKLLVIVGPTAVGKTEISLTIAEQITGEIINGDSVQVFREFDLGSAKIKRADMRGIKHHLLDICSATNKYSAYNFKQDASKLITDINRRGKVPIIVGGTGLYIQAVLYDYQFPELVRNDKVRSELETLPKEELYERLRELDKLAAEAIHPHNVKRLIRALEVCYVTGRSFSSQQSKNECLAKYDVLVIGLDIARVDLYKRIEDRVDQMIKAGLACEVSKLYAQGYEDSQPFQAIGYREFIPYFRGEYNLETVVKLIKRNSKRFAKRQLTWFRNQLNVIWCTASEVEGHVQAWYGKNF